MYLSMFHLLFLFDVLSFSCCDPSAPPPCYLCCPASFAPLLLSPTPACRAADMPAPPGPLHVVKSSSNRSVPTATQSLRLKSFPLRSLVSYPPKKTAPVQNQWENVGSDTCALGDMTCTNRYSNSTPWRIPRNPLLYPDSPHDYTLPGHSCVLPWTPRAPGHGMVTLIFWISVTLFVPYVL